MGILDVTAEEAQTQLSSVLQGAVETISASQEITFTMYVRKVLPIDGFVYWINAAIIDPAELARMGITGKLVKNVTGSLHRQVISSQDETTTRDENHIIFTPTQRTGDFNAEHPEVVFIGKYGSARFAFSRMEGRYAQAVIFHYRGMAILPTMESQIIDKAEDISTEQIISDSTSVWLTLNRYATVYPSSLIPANLLPPYIVVDVRKTIALGLSHLTADGSRYQLAQDTVKLTLYGFTNHMALGFVDYVVARAKNHEEFGITNMPIPRDEKAVQSELNVQAQQKSIDFVVNYYQQTTRDIARQLINNVIVNYEVK